ncbi:MAG: DUF1302 domain-containing protein [Betaproteobacteria bacterium]|nr:DUF1302 domain-containing protein [Betaproteobacteria bacterium]
MRPLVAAGLCVLATAGGTSVPAWAAEPAAGSGWKVDTFIENDTHSRRNGGLAKFRNTLQVEADRKLGSAGAFSNLAFHAKLRGTWDGVYQINDDRFGNQAGGPIVLEDTLNAGGVSIAGTSLAHGAGLGSATHPLTPVLGALFPTNRFGFSTAANPNDGLAVLGTHLHPTDGGVAFGVPVRPCNVDSRGCIKDYLDSSRSELESPEFNDRLDFLREAHVSGAIPLADGKELFFRIGKQQVVWGRTDLFRVLDVINPVDFSRNNIYDELQDIRIPMWIAQAEYRMGPTANLQDLNFQVVWNFDKFRPHNLGQCGSPNVILDAGCFFRGMKNLWDNGGTVANFADLRIATGGALTGRAATDFGPGQIGIRQANLPSWSLGNTQLGVKLEGVTKGGVNFSLNALTYRSQLPSLRGGIPAVNSFTGATSVWPFLIAFDIEFPRVNLLGGSLDIYNDTIKTVFRLEAALTEGEEFPNTAQPRLFSESKVFRYVIGADRPTFIPFLNKDRTFLISGQLFGQHLLDHEERDGPLGKIGMPDWKENWIGTLLIKGFYRNDRLSPQIIMARDFRAEAYAIAPSVDWLITDNLKLTVGANFKGGTGARQFDDCRSCNPFAPFTAYPEHANPTAPGSVGLTGFEPLGRFRSGPIGMALEEDFFQVGLRYKF